MSAQDPFDYDPRYITVDSVPIEIPDSYTVEKKKEALFQAESRLDIEVNGGVEIENEDVSAIHKSAVANLATYHLARSATNNSDVTLGDLDDGGEQTERHAEQYLETYIDHVDLLAESDGDGQTGVYFGATGTNGQSIAVNSGEHSRRHNLDEDAQRIVHDRYRKELNRR